VIDSVGDREIKMTMVVALEQKSESSYEEEDQTIDMQDKFHLMRSEHRSEDGGFEILFTILNRGVFWSKLLPTFLPLWMSSSMELIAILDGTLFIHRETPSSEQRERMNTQ
jgi:hypothetical protein